MKVSVFERSYKKKITFPIFYIHILIFWDAPVQCIFGYCYIYTPTTGFVVQGHIWSSLSVIRKDLSQLQIYCVISVIREFAAFIVWKKVKPVLFPGDVLLLWFILFSFLAPTSGENCNHCPLCHENFSQGRRWDHTQTCTHKMYYHEQQNNKLKYLVHKCSLPQQ